MDNTMRKLLVPAALLLLMGCNNGVKAPGVGRADPYAPSQVHVADEDLRTHSAIGVPRATRDAAGNLLYITVPIRSASDLTLYVDYRVTFFDGNGQVLSQTGWMTKTLTPNTPDQITVNSLSPQAADFQVDFRYAK
jgi:hypothetical protein